MGYTDLSVGGSDTASDLACSMVSAMVQVLRSELKEPHNEFNTPGVLNVAMVLEELVFQFEEYDHKDLTLLVKDTLEGMQLLRKKSQNSKWKSEKNKQEHISEFDELIKILTAYYKKCK